MHVLVYSMDHIICLPSSVSLLSAINIHYLLFNYYLYALKQDQRLSLGAFLTVKRKMSLFYSNKITENLLSGASDIMKPRCSD